jgi:hypothetical protein
MNPFNLPKLIDYPDPSKEILINVGNIETPKFMYEFSDFFNEHIFMLVEKEDIRTHMVKIEDIYKFYEEYFIDRYSMKNLTPQQCYGYSFGNHFGNCAILNIFPILTTAFIIDNNLYVKFYNLLKNRISRAFPGNVVNTFEKYIGLFKDAYLKGHTILALLVFIFMGGFFDDDKYYLYNASCKEWFDEEPLNEDYTKKILIEYTKLYNDVMRFHTGPNRYYYFVKRLKHTMNSNHRIYSYNKDDLNIDEKGVIEKRLYNTIKKELKILKSIVTRSLNIIALNKLDGKSPKIIEMDIYDRIEEALNDGGAILNLATHISNGHYHSGVTAKILKFKKLNSPHAIMSFNEFSHIYLAVDGRYMRGLDILLLVKHIFKDNINILKTDGQDGVIIGNIYNNRNYTSNLTAVIVDAKVTPDINICSHVFSLLVYKFKDKFYSMYIDNKPTCLNFEGLLNSDSDSCKTLVSIMEKYYKCKSSTSYFCKLSGGIDGTQEFNCKGLLMFILLFVGIMSFVIILIIYIINQDDNNCSIPNSPI